MIIYAGPLALMITVSLCYSQTDFIEYLPKLLKLDLF